MIMIIMMKMMMRQRKIEYKNHGNNYPFSCWFVVKKSPPQHLQRPAHPLQ